MDPDDYELDNEALDFDDDEDFLKGENAGDFANQEEFRHTVLPPDEFRQNQLCACTSCLFVLSKNQWSEYQNCPNCDEEVGSRRLTSKFTGVMCVTNPAKSWQATRMRIVKGIRINIAGAYAVSLNDEA